MAHTRRDFLRRLGALGAVPTLDFLGTMNAHAQAVPAGDYRALVCVFLFGGNDSNNMVVPLDSRYNDYAAVRPTSGIGISRASLLPLAQASGSPQFGLHPRMPEIQTLWQQQKAAVLFNAGTLAEPLTKAQYQGKGKQPSNLFSHSDQQAEWQTAVSDGTARTGWAGRMADRLGNSGLLPMSISTSGNVPFTSGIVSRGLALGSSTFTLQGFGGDAASMARQTAMQQILGFDRQNLLVTASGDIITRSMAAASIINNINSGNASAVTPYFANLNSGLASQLQQVAKVIEARSMTGATRQVFFVSQGGYDTHTGEVGAHNQLYAELSQSIKAFTDAVAALGVPNGVTLFTNSDFSRTFKSNTGGGTDHGWGGHHLIVGGTVKGGNAYGTFPTLQLKGPDDQGGEGRWIPTTSVDQYAATLARWFGVPASDLSVVVPNIAKFPTADLGFMS